MASDDALREAIERALPDGWIIVSPGADLSADLDQGLREVVYLTVAPLIAAARLEGWRAGREDAVRKAESFWWSAPIEWWRTTPKTGVALRAAEECASAIRALPEPGGE